MTGFARTALVTGGAGQDGIHLARRLVGNGWRVHATVRTAEQAARVRLYVPGAHLVELDVRDPVAVERVVVDVAPAAVFNLAAISSVALSWREPELVRETNAGAVDSLLLRARRRLAASVQSMTAESGAASFMTTAAVATGPVASMAPFSASAPASAQTP